MDEEKLVWWISHWFEDQGWAIEAEAHRIVAVQASGYGSGPAVVSVTDLARVICGRKAEGLV
jgi:hypothetical protein